MISDIQNGEIGSSVRAKLNQAIADINGIPTQLAAKLDITNFNWATIPNKPSTFPPSTVNWADIANKPSTFPPDTTNLVTRNKVVTSTNTSVSNTTLAPITGLSFSVSANTFYEVKIWLRVSGTAGASGIKWSVSTPSGTVGLVEHLNSTDPAQDFGYTNSIGVIFSNPLAANMTASVVMFITVRFFVSATSGAFQLNFAKDTSSANPIQALSGAILEWRAI